MASKGLHRLMICIALIFALASAALRFADLSVLQSASLGDDCIPVPAQNIQPLPDGTVNLIPSTPKLFYKFVATPKP
jgi:hypothetical protein